MAKKQPALIAISKYLMAFGDINGSPTVVKRTDFNGISSDVSKEGKIAHYVDTDKWNIYVTRETALELQRLLLEETDA